MKKLSYDQRLTTLGLPTLCYRRERADVIQVFKILEGYEEVNIDSIKKSDNTITRGHFRKLAKVRPQKRLGQNRFCKRVINNWNSISDNTVKSSSVNTCSFKTNLNKDWKIKSNKFNKHQQ